MRTYHTHFGVPIGFQVGFWDDRKLSRQMYAVPDMLWPCRESNLYAAVSRRDKTCNKSNSAFIPTTQYPKPFVTRSLQTQTLWSQLEYQETPTKTAQSSL